MPIARILLSVVMIGGGLMASPALAFDGTKTDSALAAAPPLTAMEAFRSGAHWLKAGEKAKAVHSLEYAAENGHTLAQWKLGRMYAEGDGVTQDDLKAFQYFRGIANSHADDNPDAPQSRFVANAFVALGHYYLDGIPKTQIKRDPDRAREMFGYAASYFSMVSARRTIRARRHAGSVSRRRRGSARRRPCSARCCLRVTTFHARPRAA
jgi:TPR repeat protein